MNGQKITQLVIAGGGTAGWMAAASFAKLLPNIDITLIESDEIGTVGVGEAAIPTLVTLHRLLGINEQKFMRATHATFKLAISFENWKQQADQYIHGFGLVGKGCWAGDFQHFWLHGQKKGISAEYEQYCPEIQAARAGKFERAHQGGLNYSYHFDATLYAKYLRSITEKLGARRVEGKIVEIVKNQSNGNIERINLANGQSIEGQLFLDCTGFSGLLIEKTLQAGYEDWSHWLPCDSAIAVQTESLEPAVPYTRSIAHESGWQWRIPLQHRIGNGLVYCSHYMSDEQAKETLLKQVEGETLTEPRVIKFRCGRRRKAWKKNCIATGLSSGFIEPLESTSIHLIMNGILRLIRLFPFEGIETSAVTEYNNQFSNELEHIRDFIVLHYHLTEREDSPFWRHCKAMEVPDSLHRRIHLFKETARIFSAHDELFTIDSWAQVMLGQGIKPKQYHQIASNMSDQEFCTYLNKIRDPIKRMVEQLPSHQSFIDQYCKSNVM